MLKIPPLDAADAAVAADDVADDAAAGVVAASATATTVVAEGVARAAQMHYADDQGRDGHVVTQACHVVT